MGILSRSVKRHLAPLLDLRNACAHPTVVRPEIHWVRAFFESIIQYVLAVAPGPAATTPAGPPVP
jgi:hypothetical protein